MPDPEQLAGVIRRAGIGPDKRVVAYDDQGGAMASRLWWLLRWLGHETVYVMDQGFSAWEAAKFPVTAATPIVVPGAFAPRLQPQRLASVEEVRAASAAAAPSAWAVDSGGAVDTGPGSAADRLQGAAPLSGAGGADRRQGGAYPRGGQSVLEGRAGRAWPLEVWRDAG